MSILEKRFLIASAVLAMLATVALCTPARASDYGGLPDGGPSGDSALDSATKIAVHFCGADWPQIVGQRQAQCFVAARDAAVESYRRSMERWGTCDTDAQCYNRFDRPAIKAAKKATRHLTNSVK